MDVKKNRLAAAGIFLGAMAILGGLAMGGADATADKAKGDKTMKIRSTAFSEGQPIPKKHTGEGQDVSPSLEWSDAPEGVKEFALICDDPDAPTPQPWVHWVIYKISPKATSLPEGLPRQASLTKPIPARQGKNSWPSDNVGYRGPMPPPGHGVHHYHFVLYALDAELEVAPGADKSTLLKAMQKHILQQAELIGTYKR
jgi:Raf kinase inhibitor-like YbhB/YbcL family protein